MANTKKYAKDADLAATLADALTNLPDNWLICRDMRHAWSVENDFHVTKSKGKTPQEIRRTLVCMRCDTERLETYAPTTYGMEKTGQHYKYPDNYQIHGVPRGIKPSFIVQGEQYRRAMERLVEQQKHAKSA